MEASADKLDTVGEAAASRGTEGAEEVIERGVWGSGVRQRLRGEPRTVSASNRPISGVQQWQGTVYCTSAAGTVKAFDAKTGKQVS